MNRPAKVGTWPTPYGVSVDVHDACDPNDPEAFTFSLDAAALAGGIYDPAQRKAFAQRCTEVGRADLDLIDQFGGGAPPRLKLQPPRKPIYPSLPRGMEMDAPIEAFITLMMDRHRWCDRAEALLPAVDGNLAHAAGWWPQAPGLMPAVMGLAMSLIVTAALEHLHDQEIDCIEAAAIYALSEHKQWSEAGLHWLSQFKDTWTRDWIAARPAYRRWAAARIGEGSKLPAWLAGEALQ